MSLQSPLKSVALFTHYTTQPHVVVHELGLLKCHIRVAGFYDSSKEE